MESAKHEMVNVKKPKLPLNLNKVKVQELINEIALDPFYELSSNGQLKMVKEDNSRQFLVQRKNELHKSLKSLTGCRENVNSNTLQIESQTTHRDFMLQEMVIKYICIYIVVN